MANVVGLFGDVPSGEPVDSCVECLRDLLAQAESGELVGIAYGAVSRNGQGQNGIGGMIGGYSMVGALEMAKAELIELMQECIA
jgi:hypothetical protein